MSRGSPGRLGGRAEARQGHDVEPLLRLRRRPRDRGGAVGRPVARRAGGDARPGGRSTRRTSTSASATSRSAVRLDVPDLIGVQEAVRYVQTDASGANRRDGSTTSRSSSRRCARPACRTRSSRPSDTTAVDLPVLDASGNLTMVSLQDRNAILARSRNREGRGLESAARHLPVHPRSAGLPVPARAGLGVRRRRCVGAALPLRHDAPRGRVRRPGRADAAPGGAGPRARERPPRVGPARRLHGRLQHGRLPPVAHVQAA